MPLAFSSFMQIPPRRRAFFVVLGCTLLFILVGYPLFSQARQRAHAETCRERLIRISEAKAFWDTERLKPSPPNAKASPTWDDLKPKLGAAKLTCPAGYAYEIGDIDSLARCGSGLRTHSIETETGVSSVD